MTPTEVRAHKMLKGVQVKDIAKQLGLAHSNISGVIHGRRPNFKVRQAIATAIGKTVSEIWPEENSNACFKN